MGDYALSRFTTPNAGVSVSEAGTDISTTAALGQAVENLDTHAVKDTDVIAIAQGGTGASALTNHGVVVAGASTLSTVAPSTSGNVLTSDGTDWKSSAPGTTATALAKAKATTDQAITTQADVTGVTITFTPDGTHDVLIEAVFPNPYNDTSGDISTFYMLKDGSQVAAAGQYFASGTNQRTSVVVTFVDTAPTNASHTYKMQAAGGGGTCHTMNQSCHNIIYARYV